MYRFFKNKTILPTTDGRVSLLEMIAILIGGIVTMILVVVLLAMVYAVIAFVACYLLVESMACITHHNPSIWVVCAIKACCISGIILSVIKLSGCKVFGFGG